MQCNGTHVVRWQLPLRLVLPAAWEGSAQEKIGNVRAAAQRAERWWRKSTGPQRAGGGLGFSDKE